jgi:hypothetical protein
VSATDTAVTAISGAVPTLAALLAWHRAGRAEKAAERVEESVRKLGEAKP